MFTLPLLADAEKPRPPLSAFPLCMRCQVRRLSDLSLIAIVAQVREMDIVPFAAGELADRIDRMSAPIGKGGN